MTEQLICTCECDLDIQCEDDVCKRMSVNQKNACLHANKSRKTIPFAVERTVAIQLMMDLLVETI